MRGRVWIAAFIAGVIVGLLIILLLGPQERSERPAPMLTCANAPAPLKMKGTKLNGDNQTILVGGKPQTVLVEISRQLCANPSGQWRRAPAPASNRPRACGGIVDTKGKVVQTGEVCLLDTPRNYADWILRPTISSQCPHEGQLRPIKGPARAYNVTLQLQERREGPNCGPSGLQPPRNQVYAMRSGAITSMGCVDERFFGCTITTLIKCAATGGTAECPED